MKQGQTLARYPGSENGTYSEQMWSFNVNDQGKFGSSIYRIK